MKYFLFLALIFHWAYSDLLEYTNFKDAVKQAQEDDKTIILMYGRNECLACSKMYDETFENEDLTNFIQNNFHLVHVNLSHNKKLRGYPVLGTPTFYFINKNKKVLSKLIGALEVQAMKKHIDDVLLSVVKKEENEDDG